MFSLWLYVLGVFCMWNIFKFQPYFLHTSSSLGNISRHCDIVIAVADLHIIEDSHWTVGLGRVPFYSKLLSFYFVLFFSLAILHLTSTAAFSTYACEVREMDGFDQWDEARCGWPCALIVTKQEKKKNPTSASLTHWSDGPHFASAQSNIDPDQYFILSACQVWVKPYPGRNK